MCLTVTIHTLHILFLGQLTILDIDSTQIWHIIWYFYNNIYLPNYCWCKNVSFLQTFLFASPTQFCDIVSIQQIFNRTQSLDPLFWLPDSMIAFQWVATIKHGGELTESEGFWHFYVSCCEESDWHHSTTAAHCHCQHKVLCS